MVRYAAAIYAALMAVVGSIGMSGAANAGCHGCGTPSPVYNYRTVNSVVNRTQFRDVRRTNYVHRTRHIYDVTRIRPIVRVHTVTRVHHYSVPVIHNVRVSSVQRLPAHYVHTGSVQNLYHGCDCR